MSRLPPSQVSLPRLLAQFAETLWQVHRPAVGELHLTDWPDAGRHRHDVPTAIGCVSGTMRISLGPTRHCDLVAGELVVIPPALIHQHHHQRQPHIALEIGLFSSIADVTVRDLAHVQTVAVHRAQIAGHLARLCAPDHARSRLDLARTLLRAAATAGHQPFSIPLPVKHMLAKAWWQSHWPTMDAAAVIAASGLGATRARELFERTVGQSPKTYLTCFRLGIAHGLMDAGWSMAAAAAEAGFTSVARLRRNAVAQGLAPLPDRRRKP